MYQEANRFDEAPRYRGTIAGRRASAACRLIGHIATIKGPQESEMLVVEMAMGIGALRNLVWRFSGASGEISGPHGDSVEHRGKSDCKLLCAAIETLPFSHW